MKTARSASPGPTSGSRRARGSNTKLAGLPVRASFRRRGQSLGHSAGRVGKGAAARRPSRFRSQRRLAGRLPGRAAGARSVARLRRRVQRRPPVTVRLVDWADEEGARFGRSLLGSSAFAGTHSIEADRGRTDQRRHSSRRRRAPLRVRYRRFPGGRARTENAAAYLELHIEQGPVLESWACRSAWCSAQKAWSAMPSLFTARKRTPARRQ